MSMNDCFPENKLKNHHQTPVVKIGAHRHHRSHPRRLLSYVQKVNKMTLVFFINSDDFPEPEAPTTAIKRLSELLSL